MRGVDRSSYGPGRLRSALWPFSWRWLVVSHVSFPGCLHTREGTTRTVLHCTSPDPGHLSAGEESSRKTVGNSVGSVEKDRFRGVKTGCACLGTGVPRGGALCASVTSTQAILPDPGSDSNGLNSRTQKAAGFCRLAIARPAYRPPRGTLIRFIMLCSMRAACDRTGRRPRRRHITNCVT